MWANCETFCVFFLCIVLAVSSEVANDTPSEYYGKKPNWILYLEFAAKAIAKANYSSVTLHDTTGNCGQKETLMSYLDLADEMINKAKLSFPSILNCYIASQPIPDCSELLRMGHRSSGVYTIAPRKILTEKKVFNVYCNMETEGGGWTVIQRRGFFENPRDYFYRDWKSYKEGFGDFEKEFWLGNENIFALTNQETYSARFDLVDFEKSARYAHYDAFWIDSENQQYTLHTSNYSGNAGDSMETSNDKMFSTKDQDNDEVEGKSCAQAFKGAWWFYDCFLSHLNAINVSKKWVTWKGKNGSIALSEVMIRPKYFRL